MRQIPEMAGSILNTVDDIALARAMVQVWGREAALKASDNACTQTFMGDEETARKWRRVMVLIATVTKPGTDRTEHPANG
jgi:hypothetical protein